MRRKMMTLLCAVLAWGCIAFFPERTEPVRAEDFLAAEHPEFQGVLQVWQVESFRTAGVSRDTALGEAAARFEARHPGVYVEIRSLEKADYEKCLQQGSKPDLLSHGGDVELPEAECLALEMPEELWLRGDLPGSLPWMASFGAVLFRKGEGSILSPAWEACTAELLLERVCAASETEAVRMFQTQGGYLYAGMFEAARLLQDPQVTMYPYPEPCSLPVRLQYLTAFSSDVQAREEMIRELAEECVGENTQKRVAQGCGLMPVRKIPPWPMSEVQQNICQWLEDRERQSQGPK